MKNLLKKITGFLLLTLLSGSCAYNTHMVTSKANDPVVHKGFKNVHLNRFMKHAVVYDGSGQKGDLFRSYVVDSLRFFNDTLFALIGPEAYKASIDSFVYPGEHTVIINNQVWQPIPMSKLRRIKSGRQPLSRITAVLSVISYAAFLGGLIVATNTKNDNLNNQAGLVAISGDLGFAVFYTSNLLIAKKRFIFKNYRLREKHRPLILL